MERGSLLIAYLQILQADVSATDPRSIEPAKEAT